MKSCKSEKSFVSLRDVERFITAFEFFALALESSALGKLVFAESKQADELLRADNADVNWGDVNISAAVNTTNWQWRALYKAAIAAIGVAYFL